MDCKKARERIEDFYLMVDGNWLQISASDMIIENPSSLFSANDPIYACKLAVTVSDTNTAWVLGNVFFKGFYARFDLKSRSVKLAPSKIAGSAAPKHSVILSPIIPQNELNPALSHDIFYVIIVPILIVCIIIIVVYCVLSNQSLQCKAKKKNEFQDDLTLVIL